MEQRNILVGITGGIAAYKAAILVRLLIKNGHNVKVVMTPLAKQFITPLTMATLSKNPIMIDFFDPENGQWNSHVDLGLWADAFVIAPATANTIAKMAHGIADNLLLTTYLSAKCKVFLAPAMDLDMYKHPATQNNMEILRKRGNIIIDAESGELASGLSGKGRMAEPEIIFDTLNKYFNKKNDFDRKKIIVTAGPTYEAIDPVRFIGNHSSGKMGFAIASEFAERGADVILVAGPVSLDTPPNVKRIDIVSAQQMYEAVIKHFPNADIIVLAAAVADYKPANTADKKIKKNKTDFNIELEPTVDIAQSIGKIKKNNQIIVGFALETDNEIENAKTKILKKNFDFIVLNSLRDIGAGFKYDTNKVKFIDKYGKIKNFDLKPKTQVAKDIADEVLSILTDE